MVSLISLTVDDILSGAVCDGSKKLDLDVVLPFIIVPLLLVTATMSLIITIIVMVTIAMGALYVITRPWAKNRSPFFFSWTLASILTIYLIYQFNVLSYWVITMKENFIFLVLVICTCYFFCKMKIVAANELSGAAKGKEYSPVLTADSYYCQVCQIEVNERFFHSIWWDCCVFRPNYCYFLTGQIFAFITLLFGTNLSLTTVCQPFLFYGNILMPEQCDNVYETYSNAIIFVGCVYALGYLFVVTLVLIKQFVYYVPKYSAFQWRKYKTGLNV